MTKVWMVLKGLWAWRSELEGARAGLRQQNEANDLLRQDRDRYRQLFADGQSEDGQEKKAMERVVARALERLPLLDDKKILEGLGLAAPGSPLINAVLAVAAGREAEAREMCSARGQSDADLRYNSGRLADAIDFQEELIALVEKAGKLKSGS